MTSLNAAWYQQLQAIMTDGRETSPRGQLTKELPSRTLIFDMNYPVITNPARELGYKFMAAEAWWILSGRDDVEAIAPYSKQISRFSDDGQKFFGAYGPPIVDQLDYVVKTLRKDPDTRQAVLTTWRPNPPETKDVPCTIAFSWLIRQGVVECHVFMRSSDNWLGIPYDAFNFTMLTCEIVRRLNIDTSAPWQQTKDQDAVGPQSLQLGNMYLTAASSHLYDRNFDEVKKVLTSDVQGVGSGSRVPPDYYNSVVKGYVVAMLEQLKDSQPGDERRWWE